MPQKSLYIFDMDGTLFNTIGDLTIAVNYALSKFGLKTLTDNRVKSYIGNGTLNLIKRCVEGAGTSVEDVHKAFTGFYRENCTALTKPFPGVFEFIKTYPVKKALLTNKPYIPATSILRHTGILENFDYLVCGDTTPARKPAPDGFLKILDETHTAKENAIVIGDDAPDILGAKAAGIDSVFIENGFGKRESFAPIEPTYSIPNFTDLKNLKIG